MPNKLILLSVILGIAIGFLAIKGTHAYFTATATSAENVFQTADNFPSSTQTTDHVVINEVSPVGTPSADWVELYNPTDSSVNVTGWTISDNNDSIIIPTTPQISSGGYAIITNNNPDIPNIPDGTIQIKLDSNAIGGTGGLAIAGDEVVLSNDSGIVDEMSYGDDEDVFTAPGLALSSNSGESIQRIPNGQDTNSAGDWKLSIPTLGVTNK